VGGVGGGGVVWGGCLGGGCERGVGASQGSPGKWNGVRKGGCEGGRRDRREGGRRRVQGVAVVL